MRELTAAEWRSIDDCFLRAGFFDLRSRDPLWDEWAARRLMILHPIAWSIEAISDGRWNFVERVQPWEDSSSESRAAVWQCGTKLLSLAGEDARALYRLD